MSEICPYYKTGRKCTNEKYCPEQAGFDDCMSYRYYAMDLEQKLEKIKEIASKVCVSRCGCVCNHKEEILQIIEKESNENNED